MRKLLIALVVIAALCLAIGGSWMFGVRKLSLFVDRFKTIETTSEQIKLLVYEGNGNGGTLHCDGLVLSLNNSAIAPLPNIGTTKDNQLALSSAGRVFPFGPLRSAADTMACDVPAGDKAAVSIQHSAMSWPTSLDMNFMTGKSPSWKRHTYQQLTWTKASGAKLEMVWRYEQYFYPRDGWIDAPMTSLDSPGLIRVDISPSDH